MLVFQSFKALSRGFEPLIISMCPRYRPFQGSDELNSWAVEGYPDLILMEGRGIKSHDDGGDFWQPMIIVRNDRAAWSIRGTRQKVSALEPQITGSILVLDISKKHCVTGRSDCPWLALCWNPGRSVPDKEISATECVNQLKQELTLLAA